jgi:[acyl-carrier-protein] S-malonyltransferase
MSFFLFPGQGSQVPGMGKDFHETSAAARAVFDEAAECLYPALLETMFHGPAQTLEDTRMAQPALLTVEVAIVRDLAARGVAPEGAAGHSLGEISALVACEALDFIDALRLVEARAKAMSDDVPEGGMAAVMGLTPEAIEAALPEGAQVANFNGPAQTIITGTGAGIDAATEALREAGAKRVLPLRVSGPFHSWLMKPAAEQLRPVLATIELRTPRYPFLSSVSGAFETDPEEIRALLERQLFSPVQWTRVMAQLDGRACLEVGPGSTLQGLARRMEGGPQITSAGTLAAVAALGGA